MPSKTTKKDNKTCTDHILTFKPKEANLYYPQTLNIDFCRRTTLSGKSKKSEANCFEGPVFNKDRNFQTPTFINASQKKNYHPYDFKNGIENDNRYSSYDCEKSVLLIPKPNSKSMYCSVCKQKYQDYLEHIETSRHKNSIRCNKFTFFIQEHAQIFREKDPLHSATATTESNVIVISDDEDQEKKTLRQMGKPSKRVKKCSEYYENKNGKQQKQRINSFQPQRLYPINPLFPNQPMMYNPNQMMGNYPFNLNFNYNLNVVGPNILPTFTPMLSTLSQLPNYGCFPHQMQYPIQPFQKSIQKPNVTIIDHEEK